MRRGEIMGLRWTDIDLENGNLTINRTRVMAGAEEIIKTPKSATSSRRLSLPDHIRLRLRQIKKESVLTTHGYCVTYPDGTPCNLGRYTGQFKEFVLSCKVKYHNFHSLRHYNATLMLRCGVDLKTTSRRLGHSTTQITSDLYQHVLNDMDVAAAAKINDFLTGKKEKKPASY
jgi:integrase